MQANELLKIAAQKLANAGIDSAALDARILLQRAINKPHEFLLMNPSFEVDEAVFEPLLQRRISREPVAQIIGKKEFYGRNFAVNSHVLTPRPETELIIDAAKQYFVNPLQKLDILELGVGSGCILCTLLLEFPRSEGQGVDICQNALAIAKQNAYNHNITRADFYCSDWTKNIKTKSFDLVVSNPPYIGAEEQNSLEAELRFEPEIALYCANNGLKAYQDIAYGLKDFSFKYLMLEIGKGQELEVANIFDKNGIKLVEQKKDLAGIIRTLIFTK